MIRKSLTAGICLFLLYTVFLKWFAPNWLSASQHQWQDNTIKAETFIYGDKEAYNNVVVGSSLSSRLVMDSLPKTYNLSFGGQSLFDGLTILSNSQKCCINVFIEMNFVLRQEDKSFTSSLFSFLYYPKKVLISLRSDKQPLAIIGENIKYRIVGRSISYIKGLVNNPQSAGEPVPEKSSDDNGLFLKLLDMQINNYSTTPEESQLDEAYDILKKKTSDLERRNCKIIFFEMPVNSNLTNLPQAKIVRETFYKHFPRSEYQYITLPDSLKFTTTDGVHLKDDEALEYTLYLKQKMRGFVR